jgi:phosphoglycerol transferase MdoB-like AlkP superfamily enzyme
MHPYLANGWKRNSVWPNLCFDRCMFMDDFPQKNLIRGLVSDREMFEVLLDTYKTEAEASGGPVFIFGVTMQNHSPYDYTGDDFDCSVELTGYRGDYPEIEQYLSLIHETDRAVEYLLSCLKESERDVVVVFYGDHQPVPERNSRW